MLLITDDFPTKKMAVVKKKSLSLNSLRFLWPFLFYGLLPFFSGAIEKGNSPGWFRPCCCCCFAAPRFLWFRIKNRSWKFDVIFDGFLVSIFARLGWWSWVIGRRDWRRDRRRLFCRLRFSVGNGSQSRKMEWNLSPENRKATHTQTDRCGE